MTDRVEGARRGRLRIYLGAAPGVGKTYAMLDEGRRRASRGTDVVAAMVESHDRAPVEALLAELETVPARLIHDAGFRAVERDTLYNVVRAEEAPA